MYILAGCNCNIAHHPGRCEPVPVAIQRRRIEQHGYRKTMTDKETHVPISPADTA